MHITKPANLLALCLSASALVLTGCGGGGGSGGSPPPPTNSAPQFTSPATATIAENTAGAVLTLAASDANGDPVTFAISGGPEAGFFRVSGNQLQLAEALTLNYDAFNDSDRDNIYRLIVTASDGRGASTSQNIAVTVTNDREGIAVTRILTGLGDVVGMAATGVTSRELIVGMRDGTYVRFEGNRSANDTAPAPIDFFGAPIPGLAMLDISWGPANAGAFPGLVGMFASSTEVSLQRSPSGINAEATLAFGDGRSAVGAIFFTPGGEGLAALGDAGGTLAQLDSPPRENGFGKLFRMEPGSGASLRSFDANPIGRGLQAPGGFAMIRNATFGDLVALADQGAQSEHEFSLFPENQRQMNFGWPFFEGSILRQTGAPSQLDVPSLTYPFGVGRFEGSGIVMGAAYTGTIPGLTDQFIFGDASGAIWSIITAALQPGLPRNASNMELRSDDFMPDAGRIDGVVEILTDTTGVLYLLDRDGEVFRIDRS
ncbi:MAG: cadherin repeat domain-containing protein [Erythrobacter sp.]|nr:cadherin repeat domain-containing protein [Erythrobacter sp.]